jgi:uncharacterized protein (TIGR03435 family)
VLLEDRFRLVLRKDQREMPVQELRLARDDGRLGPGLMKITSKEECQTAQSKYLQTKIPPGAAIARGCGAVSRIADVAYANLDAFVIDKTGLSGDWYYFLFFAPNPSMAGRLGNSLSALGNAFAVDSAAPAFETAVQEQLGLRLFATRGPVDVLVIESVEPPLEN